MALDITSPHESIAVNESEMIHGHSLKLTPAPVLKRVMAAVIDIAIVTSAFYVLIIVGGILLGVSAIGISSILDRIIAALPAEGSQYFVYLMFLPLILLLLAGLLVFHVFFIRQEYQTGQTPGKRVMGLKVVSLRNGGGRLTWGQAVSRDLARWYLDYAFFLPGLIAMGLTQRRQRTGDLIADTMVVYSEKSEKDGNFIYILRADYEAIANRFGQLTLPSEMVDQFRTFASHLYLARADGLESSCENWDRLLRQYNPQATALGLNQNTLLRFVAERLHQQPLAIQPPQVSVTQTERKDHE